MALSYVLGKGRASDSRLLAVARKWACISVAGDLLSVYRWIPREFNVADADSIRWENGDETHGLALVEKSARSMSFDQRRFTVDGVLRGAQLLNDKPGVQESKSEEESDSQTRALRKALRSAENQLTRLTVVRETISLRAPRLCRTIQTDRVVKRVPGLGFLESNGYRRAEHFEAYATEIEQRLNWTSAVRSRKSVWNTSTSCSPKASSQRLGVDC